MLETLEPREKRFARQCLQNTAEHWLQEELKRVTRAHGKKQDFYYRLDAAISAIRESPKVLAEEIHLVVPRGREDDEQLREELEALFDTFLENEVQKQFVKGFWQAYQDDPKRALHLLDEVPEHLLESFTEKDCQALMKADHPGLRQAGIRLIAYVEDRSESASRQPSTSR